MAPPIEVLTPLPAYPLASQEPAVTVIAFTAPDHTPLLVSANHQRAVTSVNHVRLKASAIRAFEALSIVLVVVNNGHNHFLDSFN